MLSATALCGCGSAEVKYTLSEDGTHYIVSGVSGRQTALTTYEVPEEHMEAGDTVALPVTEIGDSAFYGCAYLAKVTLPDSITRIGNLAFALCGFTHFTIPDSVTEIGYSAFGMCSSLREITVPASVTELGEKAFMGCSRLETAVVEANVTELKNETFYNSVAADAGNTYYNTALTKVYLPATMQKIEKSALYGNFITDIYFAGTQEQWDALYFYEMVKKEGSDTEYEEKVIDKKDIIPASLTVHIGQSN